MQAAVVTLAAKVEEGLAHLTKKREVKTLMVDIERLPGQFTADFWSLNDYKGRRIHANCVTEWPSTVCFAARWYGAKRTMFHSVWSDGADAMHKAAFDLYDAADLVISYNGVGFDNKHLVSGWTERGMGKPAAWRDIDLLKVARQSQGWESKTLDSVCKRLGIPAKSDKYEVEVARAAVAGNKTAQRKLRRYNENDVAILGAVYERLLPWIKSHPHVAPVAGMDANLCPRCGSDDVERQGTYSPGVYRYLAWKCKTCLGSFRTTYDSRGPSVRAL